MGFICCQCNIPTQSFLMFHFWEFLFLMCARCLLVWFLNLILVTVLWTCFSEAIYTVYLCLWWLLARLHLKWVMLKKAPFQMKTLSFSNSFLYVVSPREILSWIFSPSSYDKTNFIWTDKAFFDKWQLIKWNLLALLPLIPHRRVGTDCVEIRRYVFCLLPPMLTVSLSGRCPSSCEKSLL